MKSFVPVLIIALLAAGEYYMLQGMRLAFPARGDAKLSPVALGYLVVNILAYICFFAMLFVGRKNAPKIFAEGTVALMAILLVAKLVVLIVMLIGDLGRMIGYLYYRFFDSPAITSGDPGIPRSKFLARVALATAAVPVFSLIYGVVVNAYNYQYRKLTLTFPNLPEAFDGFRFIQLSDIHTGSFNRTEPLVRAVEHINSMNADIILFTGDLVNNITDEASPYKAIFSKLRAKEGVLSTTGNHDYGDYVQWDSPEAKKQNFKRFMQTHADMGWKLLMNENHILERNGQKIAIIGIENWGNALHFPKYGRLDLAHKGTEEIPFKILMSHDPSHWDAQVRPEYPDIDLTLSGHTHGFQFGIENRYIKFSPSQFVYKQWAGLYQEGKQYIYVNRGFGFLGYPGRVGILPEITEITLRRG